MTRFTFFENNNFISTYNKTIEELKKEAKDKLKRKKNELILQEFFRVVEKLENFSILMMKNSSEISNDEMAMGIKRKINPLELKDSSKAIIYDAQNQHFAAIKIEENTIYLMDSSYDVNDENSSERIKQKWIFSGNYNIEVIPVQLQDINDCAINTAANLIHCDKIVEEYKKHQFSRSKEKADLIIPVITQEQNIDNTTTPEDLETSSEISDLEDYQEEEHQKINYDKKVFQEDIQIFNKINSKSKNKLEGNIVEIINKDSKLKNKIEEIKNTDREYYKDILANMKMSVKSMSRHTDKEKARQETIKETKDLLGL